MYGPCLSSIGGGQPLSSPTRHSLGEPLPHQLADALQAAQKADYSFNVAVPSGITPPFGELYQTFRCVPAYYYLVCRLPKYYYLSPLDLHALSTPLAFTLS